MDAASEIGRNLVSKHQIQPEYGDEYAGAERDGRTVSRDQILRREWGQGKTHFPCSADHEEDWQSYSVGTHIFHLLPMYPVAILPVDTKDLLISPRFTP